MTSIAKQNTIEALTIYHKAQKKEWGVRVVDGNVRIASWTEQLGSRIKNYFKPDRERTNWNEKAEAAIIDKLFGEVALFQEKKIDPKSAKSLVKNIFLVDIKKPEVDLLYMLENLNLLKVKENIQGLWQIKDKKMYGLVIEELNQAKDQNLTRAKKVADFTLALMKKYSLPQSTAINAARNCFFAIENKYAVDLTEALDLVKFSGELVRERKIEESSKSIELAYYTKKFMQEDHLLVDDAVLKAKSIKKIKSEINAPQTLKSSIPENVTNDFIKSSIADSATPENYQSQLKMVNSTTGEHSSESDELNEISTELQTNKNYSKKEAEKSAPLILHLKRELELDLESALKISQTALEISNKNKVSPLDSTNILIENIKKLNPALPSGYDVNNLLSTDFKAKLKIPDEKNDIFLDFLKESAGDDISVDDAIPDFCLRDLNRSHIKFKVGKNEKTLSPGHQNEMIKEIKKLDENATVRSTLCKAIFQAGGNGIITSYAQIFAKRNDQIFGILNFDSEKNDQGSKAHFEISIEKGKSGNFTIDYTLYEKHFALVDFKSGKNHPINTNFDSSKPASKDDYTGLSKFTIELDRSDLELGFYNPKLKNSTIELLIKPSFMIL